MSRPESLESDRWSVTSYLILGLLALACSSLSEDVDASREDTESAVQALVERAADAFARRRGRRVGYRCAPDGPDRGSYTCASVSRDPSLVCDVWASGAVCREIRACVECAQ